MINAEHVEIFRKHQELNKRLVEGRSIFLSEMEGLVIRAGRCTTGDRNTLRSIEETWSIHIRYTKSHGGQGIRWRGLDPSPTVFK